MVFEAQIPSLQRRHGSQTLPTWFEDETTAKGAAGAATVNPEPMHGLCISIREEAVSILN